MTDTPRYHPLLEKQVKRSSRFTADGSCDFNALLDLVSSAYAEQESLLEHHDRANSFMAAEVMESKKLLDSIIEQYPGGLFWNDRNGHFIGCNDFFLKLFNIASKDKVIGKGMAQLNLPEGFAERLSVEESSARETGVAVLESIYDMPADGAGSGQVYLSVSMIPLLDVKARIVGVLGIFNDVTKAKRTDEELRRHRDELQHMVTEQTRDIMAAKEQAERASRIKSEFLANMSHELRTPLNSMLGMVGIILQAKDLKPEQQEMLAIVNKSANNLLEIVNDVLDISKIESNAMVLEHIGFDFRATLSGVVKALAPIASGKGIALGCTFAQDTMPYVKGDPSRIRRILTNLIGNAIKYTDTGSVNVLCRYATEDDGRLVLRCDIRDTGIGIPAEKLTVIFDKFTQADETITRKYGGTGLGLAITKELVEMMNGSIHVKSQPGKGSTFTVTFPFEISDSNDADSILKKTSRLGRYKDGMKPHATLIPIQDARILIAEDHPLNQAFIRKLLRMMGIQHMTIAEDGRQALQAYQNAAYDLILMDCHMPQMTGYEVTGEIRRIEQETGAHMPVIALTADAMEGTRDKCLQAGMNEYISKPIDQDELRELLSCWFDFGAGVESGHTGGIKSGAPEQVIDFSCIDIYASTKEEMKEFVEVFITQGKKDIRILAEQCTTGENPLWLAAAHKFKGSAGTIGAGVLHRLCSEAQQMVDVTDAERRAMVQEIEKAFDEASARLNERLAALCQGTGA